MIIIPMIIIEKGMHSLICNLSLKTSMAITRTKIISLLLNIDALTAVAVLIP